MRDSLIVSGKETSRAGQDRFSPLTKRTSVILSRILLSSFDSFDLNAGVRPEVKHTCVNDEGNSNGGCSKPLFPFASAQRFLSA